MSFQLTAAVIKLKKSSKDLKPMEKYVLLILSSFASENGECCPSIEDICDMTNLSRSSVITHLASLCEKQIISKETRWDKNGNQKSNIYQINIKLNKGNI